MSDMQNFRAQQAAAATTPTPEELAAFAQWRAAQLGQVAPVLAPVASELPDSAYEFGVGEIVLTANGYGIVVARRPVAIGVTVVGGYEVAQLGPVNDTALPATTLGITKL